MSKRFSSDRPVVILYEDEQYIAFFKPAGILTVPADQGAEPSLAERVNAEYRRRPELQGAQPDAMKLHPCHRIDKETSGVIMFAKGHASQEALMDLFRNKKVYKKYVAFVHGRLRQPRGEITDPIRESHGPRKGEEKEAITRYSLMKQHSRFAVVEIVPLTGRTNQIRIHFAGIGHPLVGESKFVFRKDFGLRFKRVALHAAELSFRHPVSGTQVAVKAPLSTDMKNFLERNRT